MIAELLDELAHSIPDLPGAPCRGHAALFDVADRHDHQGIADVSPHYRQGRKAINCAEEFLAQPDR